MDKDIQQYVRGCQSCARNKPRTHKAYGLLAPHAIPEGCWSRIGLDFITDLPPTINGNDAILVMINAYSKMAHFKAMKFKGTTAEKTADLIQSHLI